MIHWLLILKVLHKLSNGTKNSYGMNWIYLKDQCFLPSFQHLAQSKKQMFCINHFKFMLI